MQQFWGAYWVALDAGSMQIGYKDDAGAWTQMVKSGRMSLGQWTACIMARSDGVALAAHLLESVRT